MSQADLTYSSRIRSALAASAIATASLSGCSGSSAGPTCGAAQTLSVVGFTTGATANTGPGYITSPQPYSSAATFIYFSANGGPTTQTDPADPYTVTGRPVLKGSDDSTLTGGLLVPETSTHDGSTTLWGYSSSIAGLAPNVTYAVSFASLGASLNSCRYAGETAGSFLTD